MKLDIKWLAIGLALIAGAGFEISKFNPGTGGRGRTPRLIVNQDIQPYSVSAKAIDQQQVSPRQIAPQYGAVMPQPTAELPATQQSLPELNLAPQNKAEAKTGEAGEAKEEKKVTEADEYEDVIDEKTGQTVRRKKNMTEEEKAKEEEEKLAKQKAKAEKIRG